MARQFTSADWKLIRARLDEDPRRYGLPQREYGSVLLGSQAQAQAERLPVLHLPTLLRGVPHTRASGHPAV